MKDLIPISAERSGISCNQLDLNLLIIYRYVGLPCYSIYSIVVYYKRRRLTWSLWDITGPFSSTEFWGWISLVPSWAAAACFNWRHRKCQEVEIFNSCWRWENGLKEPRPYSWWMHFRCFCAQRQASGNIKKIDKDGVKPNCLIGADRLWGVSQQG